MISIGDLLNIVIILFLIQAFIPVIQRMRLNMARRRAIRAIERMRGSRLITMIHRQESVSLLGIPVARWLDTDLRNWAHDLLAPDRLRRQNIFQPAAVQSLLNDHHAGRADNRKPLWTLLAFQLWYDRYME